VKSAPVSQDSNTDTFSGRTRHTVSASAHYAQEQIWAQVPPPQPEQACASMHNGRTVTASCASDSGEDGSLSTFAGSGFDLP